MSTRLTAEQVAEFFQKISADCIASHDNRIGEAYAEAARIVRANLVGDKQFDSPRAMAWQDEPSGDGWYWVECDIPRRPRAIVRRDDRRWLVQMLDLSFEALHSRVCLIPAPPALPKRGDA